MALMTCCHLADATAAELTGQPDPERAAQDGPVEELVETPKRSDAGAAQSQVVRVILEHIRNERVVVGL